MSAAPGVAGQPPAHLDGGHEVSLEARDHEARVADEPTSVGELERPEAPAALVELVLYPVDEGVRLCAGQRRGEVLHNFGIGGERRERLAILRPPAAHDQPVRAQFGHARRR